MSKYVVNKALCPWWNDDTNISDESQKRNYRSSKTEASSLHSQMYVPSSAPASSDSDQVVIGGTSNSGRLSGSGWVCYKCGKRFKSLYWLDKHYCDHHAEADQPGKSLGEKHCPNVGCERGDSISFVPEGYVGEGEGGRRRKEKCKSGVMEGRRDVCMDTVRTCFGDGERVSDAAEHFCDYLTCERMVTTITGMKYFNRHSLSDIIASSNSGTFTVPLLGGKVVGFLLAVCYTVFYLGGFKGVRGKGVEGKRNKKKD